MDAIQINIITLSHVILFMATTTNTHQNEQIENEILVANNQLRRNTRHTIAWSKVTKNRSVPRNFKLLSRNSMNCFNYTEFEMLPQIEPLKYQSIQLRCEIDWNSINVWPAQKKIFEDEFFLHFNLANLIKSNECCNCTRVHVQAFWAPKKRRSN